MNFGYEVETLFSFYQLYQWRAKILKANSASKIEIDDGPQLRPQSTQILRIIEIMLQF